MLYLLIVRDKMSEDDGSDDKEESFLAFIPNFLVTIIWYGYVASALAWKVSGAQKTGKFAFNIGKSRDSGAVAAEGGGSFKGKRGGSGLTGEAELLVFGWMLFKMLQCILFMLVLL